jgi:hypothetical protein
MGKTFRNPEMKIWIDKRIEAVNDKYSIFDSLIENGTELVDKFTDYQIKCPLPNHGQDNRPSARYYAPVGKNKWGNFYCFKCKLNFSSSPAFISKFKSVGFMDALKDLERRFGIKIPMVPEGIDIPDETGIKRDKYVSKNWNDVPKMLEILESKLKRIKTKCSMRDYIKFCRVIDEVHWDNDRKQGVGLNQVLKQLLKQMEDVEDTQIDIKMINEIQ